MKEERNAMPVIEINETIEFQIPMQGVPRSRGTMSDNSQSLVSRKTHVHVKENPLNVRPKPGQRLGISDRFKGYFRIETGALWCQNMEELEA